MYAHFEKLREEKKAMSREEKKRIKEEKKKKKNLIGLVILMVERN